MSKHNPVRYHAMIIGKHILWIEFNMKRSPIKYQTWHMIYVLGFLHGLTPRNRIMMRVVYWIARVFLSISYGVLVKFQTLAIIFYSDLTQVHGTEDVNTCYCNIYCSEYFEYSWLFSCIMARRIWKKIAFGLST